MRPAALLPLVAVLLPLAAAAEAPRFRLPVACAIGVDCFVQNYVDVQPGAEARDFTCGPLSYDGHDGTDFRVRTMRDVAAGVAVLAAAPGRVGGVRDGEPDVDVRVRGRSAVDGRECGNGVRLQHADGWETQYCHLRRGSVAVRPGQDVAAGTLLGQIGQSGAAAFPHVHFEVRHAGRALDPFTGREAGAGGCAAAAAGLWAPVAAQALAYRPSGVLSIGFAGAPPAADALAAGTAGLEVLQREADAMVFFVRIFGLRAGDVEELRLLGPDGRPLVQRRGEPAPRNKADWYSYTGRKRPPGGWPPGGYVGEYRLLRRLDGGEAVVLQETRRLEVR